MLWRKSRAFLFILVFVLINDLRFKGKTKEEWKIIEEYLKEYMYIPAKQDIRPGGTGCCSASNCTLTVQYSF